MPPQTDHRQIINDIRLFLVNNIDVLNTGLLDALVTDDVICDTQLCSIREQHRTNRLQASELLGIIQRKPEAHFELFKQCLRKTGQGHISKRLDDELRQETGRKCWEEVESKWEPASVILEMSEDTEEQESILECMIQNITVIQRLDENIRIRQKSEITLGPISKKTHIIRVLPDVEVSEQLPFGRHVSNVIMKTVQEYGGMASASACRKKYLAIGKCKQNFFLGNNLFQSWEPCLMHGDDHTLFVPTPIYMDHEMLADPKSGESFSNLVIDLDTIWDKAADTLNIILDSLQKFKEGRKIRLCFTVPTECTFRENIRELLQKKRFENFFQFVAETSALLELKHRSIWLFLHPARYLTWIRMFPVVNAIPHIVASGTELEHLYKSIPQEIKRDFILTKLSARLLSQKLKTFLDEGYAVYNKARRLSDAFRETPVVLQSHAEFLLACLGKYITTFAVDIKTKQALPSKEATIVNKVNRIIGQMHMTALRSQEFEPDSQTTNRVYRWLSFLKLVIDCSSGSITLRSYISSSATMDGLQEAIRNGRLLRDTRNVLHLLLQDCYGQDPRIVKIKMRMIPSAVAKEYEYAEVKNEKNFNQGYQDQGTTLMEAVEANDLQKAKNLVIQGADVNFVTEKSLTPLGEAFSKNNMDLVNQLVEDGADPQLANVENNLSKKQPRGNLSKMKKSAAKNRSYNKSCFANWITTGFLMTLFLGIQAILITLYTEGRYRSAHGDKKSAAPMWTRPFLHFLVASGSPRLTEMYLNFGADVNQTDQLGATPLHLAAYMGETEIARLLLKYDADIHRKTKTGATALGLSTWKHHMHISEMLLDHIPQMKTDKKEICTPLCKAVLRDEDKVVHILLTKGSNVNEGRLSPFFIVLLRENNKMIINFINFGARLEYAGYTALHLAAEIGLTKPVGLLIKRGVGVDTKTSDGLTALHLAVNKGHTECVRELLEKGADIEAKTTKGLTVLEIATINNKTDTLEVLLKHVVKVNRVGSMGRRALASALHKNNTAAVRILLEYGANPNLKLTEGLGYVVQAIYSKNMEALRLLLKHRADPNYGRVMSPLTCALALNDTEAVHILLKHKAHPNVVDRWMCPLIVGVLMNNTDAIVLLLKYEADPNFVVEDQFTPLIGAIVRNNTFAMQLLLNNSADPNLNSLFPPLMFAINQDNMDAIRILLENNADPNIMVKSTFTPLLYAIYENKTDALRVLLENGADPNMAVEPGISPLMQAVVANKTDVIRILLKHGANPNMAVKHGISPLMLAVYNNKTNVIRILLESGPNPNMAFKAVNENNTYVIRILLENGANANMEMKESTKQYAHPKLIVQTITSFPVMTKLPGHITTTDTKFDFEQHLGSFKEKVYNKLMKKMDSTVMTVDQQMLV